MKSQLIDKRLESAIEAIFEVAEGILKQDESIHLSCKKVAFILAVNELTNDLLLGRRVALRNNLKTYKQDITYQIKGLIAINTYRLNKEKHQ